jgi:DNA-binding CsgD family transcriptional regulator
MIHEAVLHRSASKVAAYIQKYVRGVGIESREEVFELFDNMQRLFPQWVIASCPMMHPEIKYMSKNASHVLGYSVEHMLRNTSMAKFFTFVHEADQHDLHECFSYIHQHLESVPPEEHRFHRMIFYYRFLKGNGQYIHLQDEKATLDIPGAGSLYYVLFRDITAERSFKGVKAELYYQDEFFRKIKDFKPSAQQNELSKREKQLVALIKQGLSTKEIAWQLAISHHTVRNIKSRLFEKYNVNNSIELLNLVG